MVMEVSSKPSRGQSLLLFVYFQQPWECYSRAFYYVSKALHS
jgi:hypothetical protein